MKQFVSIMPFFPVRDPLKPLKRRAARPVPPRIEVRASPLDPRRGILAAGPLRLRCALGRGGVSSRKREGDGATPLAAMRVVGVFLRGGRRGAAPRPAAPWVHAGARDGWCDAPAHGAYNRPVRLPLPASAETLRRDDALYDMVVVLDWNLRSRRRGAGSAIFLHVARPGFAPTEGCVALARGDVLRLAPLLARGRVLRVRR